MLRKIGCLWLLVLLGSGAFAQVRSGEEVIAELSSNDNALRENAVRDLGKRGTGVVKPLVAILEGEDHTAAAGARLALRFMAHNASRPDANRTTREYMAKAFLAEVKGDHPLKVRRWLLRLVSLTALDENVEEVAALLDDAELKEMARWCLERIPGDRSRSALTAAGLSREVKEEFAPGEALHERCAALEDLVQIRGEETVPHLLEVVENEPPELTAVAVEALAGMEGKEITRAMAGAVGSAQEVTKAQLLRALGRRGDATALPALVAGTASSSDVVKRAALEGLGDLGAPGGADAVIDLVVSGDSGLREAAGRTLNRIEGEKVTASLIARVEEGTPEAQAVLLGALGVRGDASALDTLVAGTKSPDREVRTASIQALGRLNHESAVSPLVETLTWGEEEDRNEAEDALYHLHIPGATGSVIAAMKQAPDEARKRIIEALGRRGDPDLVKVFLEATDDMSVDVTVAALDALGKLAEPSTAPRLLEVAGTGWPEERAAALKAYIRIGEGRESAEAYEIYVKALELSVSDDERAMAVDCLGRLGDEKILPVIRPYLDGESDRLKEAAATALAPVALAMNDTDLLKRVVMQSDDVGRVQEAASKLREAGVEVDVPVRKGYVKQFWILGPLGGREEVRRADLVDAGAPVDLSATVRYNDEAYQWNYHPLDHIQGQLDLLDAVAQRGDVGAYVYAEVICEEALDVLFKLGSDDDVFCWLNGKRVHAFEGGRGWRADQDTVEVSLRQGNNSILLMVLNGGGGWAVSLRVTDRMGNPLDMEQKKPK